MNLLLGLALVLILISLGAGLFFLLRDKSQTNRTVRALTVRISLSITLLIGLLVAWQMGWIQPHPIL